MYSNLSLLRYPGSKQRFAAEIISRFPKRIDLYVEPFFGSGAIGLRILDRCNRAIFADSDFGIYGLWMSVKNNPNMLCNELEKMPPSTDLYYRLKEMDGKVDNPLSAGANKLLLHAMSFSGLGAVSGGPIGGKNQHKAKYKVACRWNLTKKCKQIMHIHEILNKVPCDISCASYSSTLQSATKRSFVYLDPPYIKQGKNMYKLFMERNEHKDLSCILHHAEFNWVLSYDDEPLVHRLYGWANVCKMDAVYSISESNVPRTRSQELIISNV